VVVGPQGQEGSVHTAFEPARGADYGEFHDGTSNTVLVIETDTPVPWTKPEDLWWTPGGPLPRLASPHDGGASSLFADGSVRFLKSSIAATTLLAILTKNGGELLGGGG
jgi:prepilin-type processing-associated H-X9-DG protein